MKVHRYLLTACSPLLAAGFLLTGCSKEKATALKTAAEQANAYAVSALASTRSLMSQSVAQPDQSREEKIREAAKLLEEYQDEFTSNALATATADLVANAGVPNQLDGFYEPLQRKSQLFSAMFRSLPEGSYFAAKAVKRAEAHAIQLAAEYMHFAQTLGTAGQKIHFAGRRAAIVSDLNRARQLSDANARRALIERAAADLFRLGDDEQKARDTAITQCLQAAEAFKTCAELIRDFDKTSVSDALHITRNLLATATDISGNRADLAKLLERYQSAENAIRADAYWKPLLEFPLNP
jgi:hypothetical protein